MASLLLLSVTARPREIAPPAAAAAQQAGRRSAYLWFWGCDDDPGGTVDFFFSHLAGHVFSHPHSPDFVTGLIPACGYNLGDALPPAGQPLAPLDRRGGFTLPCCSELHGLLSVVNRSRSRGMKVFPLLTGYTDTGPGQLRAFLANASLVRRYIDTMVQEAVKHDYDGFSFDWEYRGWDMQDESANAQFVLQLAQPLTAVNKTVSVAIDNASHPNINLTMLRGHPAITIITMSSYSANRTRFEGVVDTAAAATTGKPGGYSCGLSCAHGTPGWGISTEAEVDARFEYLERKGVSSVSIFGDWRQGSNDSSTLLSTFAPRMRQFLRGKPGLPTTHTSENANVYGLGKKLSE